MIILFRWKKIDTLPIETKLCYFILTRKELFQKIDQIYLYVSLNETKSQCLIYNKNFYINNNYIKNNILIDEN